MFSIKKYGHNYWHLFKYSLSYYRYSELHFQIGLYQLSGKVVELRAPSLHKNGSWALSTDFIATKWLVEYEDQPSNPKPTEFYPNFLLNSISVYGFIFILENFRNPQLIPLGEISANASFCNTGRVLL